MSDQPSPPADLRQEPEPDPARTDTNDDPAESPALRVVDKRWWAQADGETSADGKERSTKPSYVEDLEKQLAEKDELLRDYAARYKEAVKEFEEAPVRVRREMAKDVEREKRKVLAAFLEVIDNLDRAIGAGQTGSADGVLLTGVEMVRQQFLSVLGGYGVTPIEAAGQEFDPTLHNAVSMVPVTDAAQHNVVLTVIKLGYRAEDEILRAASVTVGRHDPSPPPR